MVGQGTVVCLTRHSNTIPWGFRLQGGKEANCPLTIQRVFVGSVSDGKLQRGDFVVSIEGNDALNMYHSRAEELIKGANRELNLSVRREGAAPQNGPKSSPQQWHSVHPHLGRSLSGGEDPHSQKSPPVVWSPKHSYGEEHQESGRSHLGAGDEDEDYSKSVGDIRKLFSNPKPQQHNTVRDFSKAVGFHAGVRYDAPIGSTSYVAKRPNFNKPKYGGSKSSSDFGWVPQNKPYPHSQTRYGPSSPRSPPVNTRPDGHHDLSYYNAPRHIPTNTHFEPPAWLGTLKSSGGPKRWELNEQEALVKGGQQQQRQQQRAAVHSQPYPGGAPHGRSSPPVAIHNPRVQNIKYGPGGNGPLYEQHNADNVSSDSARVAHLQYNTPIGLYSKQNAIEALQSQTGGKPGQGTLLITGGGPAGGQVAGPKFSPSRDSAVYRLILEEEGGRAYDAGISDF